MSESAPPTDPPVVAQPLPGPVRARVVALTAQALPVIPSDRLPGKLRRFATFAPARRARLAGAALAAALEDDTDFREAVAEQLRAGFPDAAQALDDGCAPAELTAVEHAALAYLLRPSGWADVVESLRGLLDSDPDPDTEADSAADMKRLAGQLDSAREEIRGLKDRHRDRLAELRSENADLRRRMASLNQQLRSAQQALEVSDRQLSEQRSAVEAAAGRAEAEARRLRARIGELEAEAAAVRRATREGRDAGSLRARLLLDTVIETAQGLRRELALPPVSSLPADTVPAVVPPAGAMSGQTRGRSVDDPALLAELLTLPRVHLVVDGYNVTKTAWPTAALEAQRNRLLAGLAALVARTGAEVTVVFDGAELDQPPVVNGPRGVRVRFSPPGVSADEVIRRLVAAEPTGRPVVAASSDREIAEGVEASGARAVASRALVDLLSRS